MAIYVKTDKASELLDKLKKAIDDDNIKTWKYDKSLKNYIIDYGIYDF